MMPHPLIHLAWIVPLAALAVYIGSPRHLGTSARRRVARLLHASLDRQRYSVLEDLTLPGGGGSFDVDVLVVSRSGIFVIDAISRRGRLSGTRVQPLWKEKRFGRVRRFDNPVHANTLRIQALERLLDLRPSRFRGFVAVNGKDRLDAGLPDNVVTPPTLLRQIRSENRALLEPEEADRALVKLRGSALRPTWRERKLPWKLARLALVGLLIAGVYGVYRADLKSLVETLRTQAEQRIAPEDFHPDGRPKTERERWEDRLICSYSTDTARCACYEPGGERADVPAARCRELAERGSILQR